MMYSRLWHTQAIFCASALKVKMVTKNSTNKYITQEKLGESSDNAHLLINGLLESC